MKWISVKDRLPEYKEMVIFYLFSPGVDSGYKVTVPGKRISTNENGENYKFFSNIAELHCYEIISWQPLPKPPKEAK